MERHERTRMGGAYHDTWLSKRLRDVASGHPPLPSEPLTNTRPLRVINQKVDENELWLLLADPYKHIFARVTPSAEENLPNGIDTKLLGASISQIRPLLRLGAGHGPFATTSQQMKLPPVGLYFDITHITYSIEPGGFRRYNTSNVNDVREIAAWLEVLRKPASEKNAAWLAHGDLWSSQDEEDDSQPVAFERQMPAQEMTAALGPAEAPPSSTASYLEGDEIVPHTFKALPPSPQRPSNDSSDVVMLESDIDDLDVMVEAPGQTVPERSTPVVSNVNADSADVESDRALMDTAQVIGSEGRDASTSASSTRLVEQALLQPSIGRKSVDAAYGSRHAPASRASTMSAPGGGLSPVSSPATTRLSESRKALFRELPFVDYRDVPLVDPAAFLSPPASPRMESLSMSHTIESPVDAPAQHAIEAVEIVHAFMTRDADAPDRTPNVSAAPEQDQHLARDAEESDFSSDDVFAGVGKAGSIPIKRKRPPEPFRGPRKGATKMPKPSQTTSLERSRQVVDLTSPGPTIHPLVTQFGWLAGYLLPDLTNLPSRISPRKLTSLLNELASGRR